VALHKKGNEVPIGPAGPSNRAAATTSVGEGKAGSFQRQACLASRVFEAARRIRPF